MKKSEKNKLQSFFKRGICGLLAFMMLITAFPLQALAADLNYDKTKITSQQNLNKEPVTVMQTKGKKAEEVVKNPDMPKLYTMRADYKLPRNDEQVVGYQPYIATVGDDEYTYTDFEGNEGQKVLTGEEKSKINKTIDLPDIDGYTSPTKSFNVNYNYIKENAKKGNLDVNEYKGEHPYLYKAKQGTIKIKHTFQKLENRDEYGLKDGDNKYIYTYQTGVTGTSVTIKALDGERIKGYVPEVNVLTTQVPQNSADFEIEMRYNRAIFDVNFDSKGGTDLPGMTLIYGQTIPKLNFDIKKLGSNLQGWKVNKDIDYLDADGNKKTLTTDTLITKKDFEAGGKFQDGIKNAMPAEGLTFTAQWTENEKAEYVIQFWTEKPDYDDKDDALPLRDRYDFIGARRIDNADTGSTPELTNLDIHGITFPDLNDGRLEKAQNNKEEFERYYFLNEDLTKKQNASEDNPEVQKSVLSTGETVYNVYYDRRVYTLYFTSINDYNDPWAYWPIITRNGQVLGKEGDPYKVNVRFNQSLDGIWPKDEEVSGLPDVDDENVEFGDDGLIGWTINNNVPMLIFRDTPPYRLSAEDFIDPEDVLGTDDYSGHGHANKIPIGKNKEKDRVEYEISFGASYYAGSIVHHIDIIKDDFNGKEQIDYDMSYWKSDTEGLLYDFILPHLQGFTLKEETRRAEWVGLGKDSGKYSDVYKTFDDLNAERSTKTPFRSDADKIEYIDKFPWGTKSFDGRNAYNFARYSRNKYKLKLNNDPKTVKNDSEYGAGNILDIPYEKPLKDLKLDTAHVPERPDWVPKDWDFLGWALDTAGENLVKDGNETKLHYDQVLYAKWGEPETIWKVKFDPNGGSLADLSTKNISDESKKIEKDGETHTYPEKVAGENTFNFVHKMILKEPKDATNNIIEPKRDGYNFAGWEFVRYTKDKDGNDTEVVDTSYKDLYKVPEMYHFGNEVVGNVHLRAIWNKQDLITVEAIHHFLNADYSEKSNEVQKLYNRRVGSYTTGLGSRQGDKYLLVPQAEWDALYNANADYQTYKDETARENSYNQILRVEPEKVHDPETGNLIDNPKAKNNRFEFFYKPFKERVYQVNYLDDRGKAEVEEFMTASKAKYQEIKNNTSMTPEEKSKAYKDLLSNNKEEFAKIKEKYTIVPNETVVNGKRHYDARNYRKIPGWVLNDKPQQQLFFDIYEDTDTFAGINETGLDEINFFYKDVRIIEVKDPDDPVPKGYVRVKFVAEEGGNFTDSNDNPVEKLYYDVIVGLKSDNLPVPEEVKEGGEKVEGKYYITPDAGKKFIKWDKEKLLNSNTIIDRDYTFTAYFDWSGVKVHELVRTESYKDSDGNWNNDFAPSLDELKEQVKWVNKDGKESDLPKDAIVTIVDENGKDLTQDDVYEKVKELGKLDSDELIRTVKFSAKVKFADNSVQDIEIPVKIYKNVYEGLTTGAMPKVLKDATSGPDGDLVKVTGDYVKVTVNPTGKPGEKDSKIYYVNPKAWVEIPEIKLTEKEKAQLGFTHWTADVDAQNENGVYDFAKRHMFTEDTVISPGFSKDVVEQKDGEDKPAVPDNFVKVIVKTTDKATTEFTKTFWVNPSKEVTIPVDNPVGKTVDKTATEESKAWTFTKWQSDEETPRTWTNGIKGQFTKDTTITAEYDDVKNIIPYDPNEPITRPDGYVRVKFEADDGLTLSKVNYYYVKANAGITLGKLAKASVTEKTGYKFNNWDKDDTLEITNADIVVKALSRKIDPVIPEKNDDGMPNDKPEGYKEVVFVAAENGKLEGLTKFYVNPDEYVTINPPTAVGNTGYEFGSWDKDATIPTVYKEDTTITASFNELKAVIPKTKDDDKEKAAGYKTVTFVIEGEGGKIVDGETTTYFVNPEKEVTINPPTTNADTGYKFNAWDKDTRLATKYAVDTKIKGTFTKLDDIIPSTDDEGNENPKPDGYVTVTFDKGEHGKDIKGQRVYYVNPKADKTLANITKPIVSPETGWRTDGWDKDDTQFITDDLTVNAKYTPIDDVIPKEKPDGGENEKPEGYITVTFDKGKHGTLTGNTVFYVNPNKAVVLEEKAPTVNANKGYTFARWDTSIEKAIQFKDGDKITALYNEPGNISETEVEGYVKVEFNKGQHGSLEGKTEYWVKPGVEVNLPAPTVKADLGYKFTDWDKSLTVTLKADDPTYVITAEYEDLGNIIPQEKPDGSDKPEGYVSVTFKAVNGSLEGTTTYYVKPNVQVDLTDTANEITKKADLGYTAERGTWDKALKATFTNDEEFTFNFKKLDDVIEDKGQDRPEGYVTVKFIPTSNAQDPTEKVYFVNPKVNVTIAVAEPVGKEVTDASGNKYTFNFKLWTVTRGSVATWDKGTAVSGQFIQETEITAKYSTKVDAGEIIPSPIGKKNVVTPINEMPKPEDLIKNIFDPNDPNNKDNLPDGTTFTYTNDGTPDVSNPGTTTGKVEVKYPNGKTVVVEVPIKVVDHVVPQTGDDKPLVPENYVKVTVDTTDRATANTKFTKVFWVKPAVEVTIPDILAPTGKEVTEAGVTKTNKFVKWVSDDNNKEYTDTITDTFTKDATIIATYEFDKNVEPVGKNNQWIPQGSNPSPKDFIKNPYDDNDPKNPDNLPPGTRFEFVPGAEPDTQTPGTDKGTTIKVIYPNGETREVPVTYNVTGDVVEQPDPNDPNTKPDVPDNFVKVVVDKTEKAELQPGEQQSQTFWVNPEKVVTLPVAKPTGKVVNKEDGTVDYTWLFTGWDKELTKQFTEETRITAQYKKDYGEIPEVKPIPEAKGDFIYTDLGKEITDEQYKNAVKLPDGYSFDSGTELEIVENTKPNVNVSGKYYVDAWVTYPNGESQLVTILVYVGEDRPDPKPEEPDRPDYPYYPEYPDRPYIPMYPEVRYETIIQEKIVKVPMPISDDNYFKEVRYMQGFKKEFRPHDGLTRAEAAQILANALVEDGYKYNPNYKLPYKDIGEAWYTRAVKIVTEANVFEGYDDGNFKPQGKITRNEWIATLKRFQELNDLDGNHMNLKDGHWASKEIEAAYKEGWLKIYTDGLAKYEGDKFIPREEVAAVSNKAFKRTLDKTYIRNNEKSLITYKDVKKDMWSYEDILCASNTFLNKKDLYRAHWINEDNNTFNIDTRDFEIVKEKFQRNPR